MLIYFKNFKIDIISVFGKPSLQSLFKSDLRYFYFFEKGEKKNPFQFGKKKKNSKAGRHIEVKGHFKRQQNKMGHIETYKISKNLHFSSFLLKKVKK